MTTNVFINKYKPYKLDDFHYDNDFIQLLKYTLHIDSLNLLIIGNSNSGKTTLLNILIREYYELSSTDSIPDNNILYINSLKEQGIQYFRNEMKTFCQSYSSIYKKKKIVIIDDIDNINEQSQQVFRNYIDKYKKNIHFVMAATSIQKVIESIQSRLHIVKIPIYTDDQKYIIMNQIIQKENIIIDEESKKHIIKISNNSIRILINFLEKFYIYKQPVDIDICKKICSNISSDLLYNYFYKLTTKELSSAIEIVFSIYNYGYSVLDILDCLFQYIKVIDIIDENKKYQIISIICKYITIFHNIHEDSIELALFTNNIYEIIQS
tara:strand:+ start:2208 stop:3176 length:969 start_codon:yes stop_codon:yes gene_type:complete